MPWIHSKTDRYISILVCYPIIIVNPVPFYKSYNYNCNQKKNTTQIENVFVKPFEETSVICLAWNNFHTMSRVWFFPYFGAMCWCEPAIFNLAKRWNHTHTYTHLPAYECGWNLLSYTPVKTPKPPHQGYAIGMWIYYAIPGSFAELTYSKTSRISTSGVLGDLIH